MRRDTRSVPESDAANRSETRRAGRSPAGLLILAVAIVAVYVSSPEGAVRDWSYLVVAIGASVAAWFGAERCGDRRLGRLVAAGVSLSGLGDLVWQILVWVRGDPPDISIADIGYLGSYGALAAALLFVLRGRSERRLDLDGWIDIGVVIVVSMLLQWQLALHTLIGDPTVPGGVRLIWAAYPALDSVILALVLRSLLSHRLRGAAGSLLGAGVVCWLAADFIYTFTANSDSFSVWLDAGWLGGVLLFTAAIWWPVAGASDEVQAVAPAGVGYLRMSVALLPLVIPGLLELVGYVRGQDPNPVPLFLATVVLVGLAFARSARVMRSERQTLAAARSKERFAAAIAANSSDAFAVLDSRGVVLSHSSGLGTLLGQPGLAAHAADAFSVIAVTDVTLARKIFERALRSPGSTFDAELRVGRTDAAVEWLGVRLVDLLGDPDVEGVIVNLRDVTDRKIAEEELAHQAFHDGLTGLANRSLFTDRVAQALRRTARTGLDPAVLFLDLDGFKNVNDSLGHGPGDDLLREVAERLTGAVRDIDTVARLGGDEFAVLIEQSTRPVAEAEAVAARILQSLSAPIALDGLAVTISASIGIAAADGSASPASLLRDADVAMYRAKTSGKDRWVVYEPEMRVAAVERLQMETDLAGALAGGQLALVYQPVVELETERVVGFEALLRWHHPTLGTIAPDRFIPLAEESGLIIDIGRWVLQEACRTAARWHHAYPEQAELSMAVNVSARQIASTDLVVDVAEALATTGLTPHTLVVELTETALVGDATVAARRLQELRGLGIRLAIDDFGTGYSSLSYLRQFPVDILKIDRSFIESIADRGPAPAIVRGLLDLARTLNLEAIAEGVELELQRDRLRDEHCEFAQGFLFARPLEVSDAELLLMDLPPRTPLESVLPVLSAPLNEAGKA